MWILALKFLPWLTKAAPLFGLIKGKAKLIVPILSLVCLLGTWAYINGLKNDLSERDGTIILMQSDIDERAEVNVNNVDTITKLRAANWDLARAAEVSEETRAAAADKARERDRNARLTLTRTARELQELRDANPTCDQISKIDVGAACPLIIQRLRDSERSASEANRDD